MTQFRYLPNLDDPSLRNERTSSGDYTTIKNLFKRAKIRDDLINAFTAFEKYQIVGDRQSIFGRSVSKRCVGLKGRIRISLTQAD